MLGLKLNHVDKCGTGVLRQQREAITQNDIE